MAKASKIQSVRDRFIDLCKTNKVPHEVLADNNGVFASFIYKEYRTKSRAIIQEARALAHNDLSMFQTRPIDSGIVVVVSEGTAPQTLLNRLAVTAKARYTHFSKRLDDVLLGAFEPTQRPKKLAEDAPVIPRRIKKSINLRIAEALNGIATEDGIQPQEALRLLYNAMQDMGLVDRLKQSGVTWHIPDDKHSVTFNRQGMPVLQLNAVELGDEKGLGEVLLQLQSIADGEAPQATQVSSAHVKDLAAQVRGVETQAKDIAARYTQPQQQAQPGVPGQVPPAGQPAAGQPVTPRA